MFPNPTSTTIDTAHSDTLLRWLLGGMYADDDSAGPDYMARSSGRRGFAVIVERHLAAAVLWFWFGIQKHDKNIYLPCVGWMVLDR
jgi:hypothetical protein